MVELTQEQIEACAEGAPPPCDVSERSEAVTWLARRVLELQLPEFGCALAMRVLQSDLYLILDDTERAECDELITRWHAFLRPKTTGNSTTSSEAGPFVYKQCQRHKNYHWPPMIVRTAIPSMELCPNCEMFAVIQATGTERNAIEQGCGGCGEPLLLENAWMEDGCPCNTAAGVNNLNFYRWKLLHDLQQKDARRAEAAERELEALRGKLDGAKEADTEQYLAEVGRGIGALVPLTGSDD